MYPVIYFPYADDQVEFLQSRPFAEVFLLHLLFRGDLAITDGFFWSSRGLASLNADRIVVPCLRFGAIRPVLRVNRGERISAAYDEWAESTLGLNAAPDARARMERVDELLESNRGSYQPIIWPPRSVASVSGEVFRATQRYVVEGTYLDALAERHAEANEILTGTKVLRQELVPQASENGELSRGRLLQVLGEHLAQELGKAKGWTAQTPIHRLEDLLLPLRGTRRRDLEHFAWWLADCYALGQAQAFGVGRTFSPSSMYFQAVQLATINFRREPIEPGFDSKRVEIPRLDELVRWDITELLQVRANEGGEYFAALAEYRNATTKEHADALKNALAKYATALCKRFEDIERTSLGLVITDRPLGAVMKFLLEILATIAPPALSVIGSGAALLYKVGRHQALFERLSFQPADTIRVVKAPLQLGM